MKALWCDTALLPGGWASSVRISAAGGEIAAVEIGVVAGPDDERAAIVIPGLPNLHSHAFQRGMAGLAETRGQTGDDFWTWREVMYRFLARLTPEDVEAIAAQAYAEMLASGFTRVGEFHYLHHDADGGPYAEPAEMATRIAAAAAGAGIGLTLLPVFYAHSGFGAQAPGDGQRRFINSVAGYGRLVEQSRAAVAGLPDAVVGIAPHSLRAATPEELTEILPLAQGGPIHVHIAEQWREVEDCLAWSNQRPVEWLLSRQAVDARWCLVHATHMTQAETRALARSGATAGLCPITEANLGDGLFPAQTYLTTGGKWGVGSDSNVLIDAAEELRLLEYGQRLAGRGRARFASPARPSVGGNLFDSARAGGSAALGVSGGGIATGQVCDLVSLKADHPSLIGRSCDGLLDGWIFAAPAGAVDKVWRRGERVVEGGRHVRAEVIGAAYRRVLERVLAG